MSIKSLPPLLLTVLSLVACAPAPVKVADAPAMPLAAAPAKSVVDRLFAYRRWLDGASQADLNKELTALNSVPASAETEVRKAMVLGAMRDSARLARARTILDNVLLMNDSDALALRPLVEWMIDNNTELRRVTSLNERQALQLKDTQRRFDQLSEKLDAMKRIESSQPASPIEIAPAN
jgi:hypothetical protein